MTGHPRASQLIAQARSGLAAFDQYLDAGGPVDAAHGRPWELVRGLLALVEAVTFRPIVELSEPEDHGREALALAIARSMPGWNDVTSEPEIADESMRGHMEAKWESVNAECLRQGREYADIAIATLRGLEVSQSADQARAHALHDAFWAVHVGRFHGRDAEHGVDTFYAGTNAAKRAIEGLHGSPIIRPWPSEPSAKTAFDEHVDQVLVRKSAAVRASLTDPVVPGGER